MCSYLIYKKIRKGILHFSLYNKREIMNITGFYLRNILRIPKRSKWAVFIKSLTFFLHSETC